MRLFDAYLAIDWSAKGKAGPRKPAPDSLWVGELVVDQPGDGNGPFASYWRTRRECIRHVRMRLVEHAAANRRVFVGFDFAYGYPAGFVSGLGLTGYDSPWRQVWQELTRLIEDRPDNRNNHFEIASALNAQCGLSTYGPLWGCPAGIKLPNLLPTSPAFPYEITSQLSLERLRLTERRLSGVQSVWKLFGPGSVGSQSMLGIPAVCTLRDDPELRANSRVWPFETGFGPRPTPSHGPFVLHVEIWPGVVNGLLEPMPIRDEAQVRAMVQWLGELDARDELAPLFDTPTGLTSDEVTRCTKHEGWIFGTDWRGPQTPV